MIPNVDHWNDHKNESKLKSVPDSLDVFSASIPFDKCQMSVKNWLRNPTCLCRCMYSLPPPPVFQRIPRKEGRETFTFSSLCRGFSSISKVGQFATYCTYLFTFPPFSMEFPENSCSRFSIRLFNAFPTYFDFFHMVIVVVSIAALFQAIFRCQPHRK